jgi:hypothetical protein
MQLNPPFHLALCNIRCWFARHALQSEDKYDSSRLVIVDKSLVSADLPQPILRPWAF